ncbi:MAG: recombinase family protein [Aristaeellaceae bacterium]
MKEQDPCIAIYSRKSRFTGKGESIGNQVELCRAYIAAHDGPEALAGLAVYEDEGFSGGNLNRPAFQAMMKAAREKRLRAIIVYRLDRISRNISDFAALIGTLSQLGVAFISIREQFDTGTPMGRAMMYIASVFSQLERETIAERIRDNMHELAKTGRWLGGVTPTGYAAESVTALTVDGKTRRACRLRLIPEEAELVRTVYGLFLQSRSLTATEAELMQRGLRTRRGKYFSRFAIRAMLQNPVYLVADGDACRYFEAQGAELYPDASAFDGGFGVMAYNRTDQKQGSATVHLPVSRWIIAVGQHPGLIPGSEWVQVQEALAQNRAKSFRRPRTGGALLSGLVYCACGSRMYPKQASRRGPDGTRAFSYVCRMRERSRGSLCRIRSAPGSALDGAVLTQLAALPEDAATFAALLRQPLRRPTAPAEEQLAALRQEKAQAEKRLAALVDSLAMLAGMDAREPVLRRIGQLQRDCEAIGNRMAELAHPPEPPLEEQAVQAELSRLASMESCLAALPPEQQRSAVAALVQQVVWDGAEAHLTPRCTEDDPALWREDSK